MTLWFETALLPGGWAREVRLTLADGKIASIETETPRQSGDTHHFAALPGLSNVHSHAFQRGMAGLAETRGPANDDFWTWREVMYRFLDRLTPDDNAAIAAQAYAEMLESGFTRVGEFHYVHNDPAGAPYADPAIMAQSVALAAAGTGIALSLLPVFYAHSNFAGAAPKPGQRRFISNPESFARLVEGANRSAAGLADSTIGIAPHSLRAVTPDELTAILPLAGAGPVHIHAAEQTKEVEDCLAWSSARPVEWLLAHAEVNERWCLIHATHMTESETDALAAAGAVAGLCPVTEANLGDGIFPAARYLAKGGRFGIGTDSNILIDPAGELRALEYSQRLSHRARNILGHAEGASIGRTLFDGALAGGAQALGVAAGLAVGQSADLVALKADHPSLAGRSGDALLDGWIFAARTGAIDSVWRAGRQVVAYGNHIAAEAIRARYRDTLTRLLA